MKKMSEAFNGKPCGFSPRMTDEQVRHGQHAINHVDALAEALEAILDSYESQQLRDSLLDAAKATLSAYRGEL